MFRELDTPRIYIACLASYNAGMLHGEWIDATQDAEDIWSELRSMLASSSEPNVEEWAIHDYEGFGNLRLSEYEGIERVHKLATFIEEHEKVGAAVLEYFGGDLEDAKRTLAEYLGTYSSIADYAQQLTEETSEIPKHLENHIDYESMGRDMDLNGDILAIEVGHEEVYLFTSV